MRDILFRGKIKDSKVWAYGYLNQHRGEPIYDVYIPKSTARWRDQHKRDLLTGAKMVEE